MKIYSSKIVLFDLIYLGILLDSYLVSFDPLDSFHSNFLAFHKRPFPPDEFFPKIQGDMEKVLGNQELWKKTQEVLGETFPYEEGVNYSLIHSTLAECPLSLEGIFTIPWFRVAITSGSYEVSRILFGRISTLDKVPAVITHFLDFLVLTPSPNPRILRLILDFALTAAPLNEWQEQELLERFFQFQVIYAPWKEIRSQNLRILTEFRFKGDCFYDIIKNRAGEIQIDLLEIFLESPLSVFEQVLESAVTLIAYAQAGKGEILDYLFGKVIYPVRTIEITIRTLLLRGKEEGRSSLKTFLESLLRHSPEITFRDPLGIAFEALKGLPEDFELLIEKNIFDPSEEDEALIEAWMAINPPNRKEEDRLQKIYEIILRSGPPLGVRMEKLIGSFEKTRED